jgi:hypothetical protein
MTVTRFVVLGICALWAVGGFVVMLGYPSDDAAKLTLSAAINFGPLTAALVFFIVRRRN